MVFEILVRWHNLPGSVYEHVRVIHVAPLLLRHSGIGRVRAVAQRPDRVEGARVKRVANLQLRNVSARNRSDNQCVRLRQADGIIGIVAPADVFFEQAIHGVQNAPGLAAREDDFAAVDVDGVAFVAQRGVGADGKAAAARFAGLDFQRRAGQFLNPMLQFDGGVGFLRRRVRGKLNAAERFSALDHLYLSSRPALRLERVNPFGLRAHAKKAGDAYDTEVGIYSHFALVNWSARYGSACIFGK